MESLAGQAKELLLTWSDRELLTSFKLGNIIAVMLRAGQIQSTYLQPSQAWLLNLWGSLQDKTVTLSNLEGEIVGCLLKSLRSLKQEGKLWVAPLLLSPEVHASVLIGGARPKRLASGRALFPRLPRRWHRCLRG